MADGMPEQIHAHPCGFHLVGRLDRGWGESAFEYRWNSTDSPRETDRPGLPELAHCMLYELTRYDDNDGRYNDEWLFPPDPPFVGWRFRNPTDGRTGPVGMERFSAAQGWAWDRHKLGGRLVVPAEHCGPFEIRAVQEYRFHCGICGLDDLVPGPDGGPHTLVRAFAPATPIIAGPAVLSNSGGEEFLAAAHSTDPQFPNPGDSAAAPGIWRYSFTKHGHVSWMDLSPDGYAGDSLHLGFGPW